MKTVAGLLAGLVAAYLTLLFVVSHVGAASAACSQAFTLPALACRFGGLGVMLLLVPAAGIAGFVVVRRLMST